MNVTPHLFARFIAGALLMLVATACGSPSFPELAAGSYTGQISSVVKGSEQSFSFYAERLGKDSTLLFVVFAQGWNPQVVSAAGGTDDKKKRPMRLTTEGVTYILSGSSVGDGFQGLVETSDGRKGKWFLTPISSSELKHEHAAKLSNFDLRAWLFAKVKFNSARDEFDSLRASFEQDQTKLQKLEKFVKDEDVLRDRSRSRKDALATELNRITAERKKNTQQLKDSLSDLSLLHRYTKEGQAIDLNRRISRRETKWYSINWTSGGSAENVEEELAEQEQIDLKKLNAAVKHAEEIRRLQNSISEERQKIAALENEIQTRIRVLDPPAPPEAAPTDKSKPWWKAWE